MKQGGDTGVRVKQQDGDTGVGLWQDCDDDDETGVKVMQGSDDIKTGVETKEYYV